ncbi:DUF1330 domain-containing protein [Vibrio mediterranei]|nr:DUF1330 domain-containing protein [Vibrio mediterranei]MCY9852313.1 DUF1330 domain-containing protein [Vibrio mediterranei]
MSTYYSVLEVTPTSQDWVSDYIGPANKLVAKYGGKYLARTNHHERLEGERQDPALRIIIEWPSHQAAKDFMKDPEYPAPYLTNQRFSRHHALIEAKDDLT